MKKRVEVEIENSVLSSIKTLKNYCKAQRQKSNCGKCVLFPVGCTDKLPCDWTLKLRFLYDVNEKEINEQI